MVGRRMLNLTDTRPMACRDRQFPAVMFKTITGKGPVMKDSVIRLKNLCEILLNMGVTETPNDQEIKKMILALESTIIKEMELLKDRESMSE